MQTELKDGKTFEESAKGRDLTVEKTGPFMRNEPIPTIGSDPAFTQAAFALTSGAPATEQPVKGNAGFYVLRLIQRKLPEASGFENEKDAITSMLQRRKQRIVLQDWMAARKEASQIEIEETYLK